MLGMNQYVEHDNKRARGQQCKDGQRLRDIEALFVHFACFVRRAWGFRPSAGARQLGSKP